jgi:hypothetical protein
MNEQWRKKISLAQIEKFVGKETRLKQRLAKLGRFRAPASAKTREINSKARIKVMLEGRGLNNWSRGVRGLFFSIKNKCEIRFDSLLEEKALLMFESLGSVLSFGRCAFAISYKWNDGSLHLYHPDFFVKGISETTVHEIKPARMFQEDHNPKKFKAAIDFCSSKNYQFRILTEQELGKQIASTFRDAYEFNRMKSKIGEL